MKIDYKQQNNGLSKRKKIILKAIRHSFEDLKENLNTMKVRIRDLRFTIRITRITRIK